MCSFCFIYITEKKHIIYTVIYILKYRVMGKNMDVVASKPKKWFWKLLFSSDNAVRNSITQTSAKNLNEFVGHILTIFRFMFIILL